MWVPQDSVRDEVWVRRVGAMCYLDLALVDGLCTCRTDRRGTFRREDHCRAVL